MQLRRLLVFVCPLAFLFQSNSLSAQKLDSVLGVYSSHYQQEKVYLHYDKAIYNAGETIWYKAYLLAGTDLSDYSKNFYVDIFDANGKIINHIVSPMLESSARGQFDIPADYAGQTIHVRAYTKWMLNFDTAFLYNKDIFISQPKLAKTVQIKPVTSLHFFPEGGDLITGLPSRIAFKANNQFGMPVNVKGIIKTSGGVLVDSFISVHDGMGSFSLEPLPNTTYTASWIDESGKTRSTDLPLCKSIGANLQIQALATKAIVMVNSTVLAGEKTKSLNIIAHMNQQVVFRSKVSITPKQSSIVQIPINLLPTGVLQITLFDQDWLPLAERVIFVNNHHYEFHPEITTPVASMEKRGKNVVEINVSDSVISNLSVSITDEGLGVDKNDNIVSQLLLCSDIKGYIYNPAYYFSGQADSISEHLDLVMLTHGWRRFKWDEVVQEKMPVLKFARDSDYMQIKGKVFGGPNYKVLPDQKIIINLQAKDSSTKTMILPVNLNGSFAQKNLSFFDTLKVFYQIMGDKKLASRTEITFETGLLLQPNDLINNTKISPYLWQVDTAELSRTRFFAAEQAKLEKLAKSTTLADVVVISKAARQVDVLDKKYTKGMFSRESGYQFDMINDPRALSSADIFNFLQGMVPGLTIQYGSQGRGPTLKWRGSNTEMFIDEMSSDPDQVNNLQISDIAYVKVFRPPFYGAFGGGAGGAISIYTRRGVDASNSPVRGVNYKLLPGYTAYKEFYSPDYSVPVDNFLPDVRTTLYWNPYILTDATNHKVKIEFYNNDISKKMHVVLEGVNANGKLARVEKVIE